MKKLLYEDHPQRGRYLVGDRGEKKIGGFRVVLNSDMGEYLSFQIKCCVKTLKEKIYQWIMKG